MNLFSTVNIDKSELIRRENLIKLEVHSSCASRLVLNFMADFAQSVYRFLFFFLFHPASNRRRKSKRQIALSSPRNAP